MALTDISILSGLTNLRRMNLGQNKISNISPLSSLANLVFLRLDQNQISDKADMCGSGAMGWISSNLTRGRTGKLHWSHCSVQPQT